MTDLSVTIVGNLTGDPELRFTASGVAVARVSIAHNPRTLDRASGEWKDGEPTFLTGTVWRDLAEHVAESLTKGARVIAHGRLRTETWDDQKTGDKRSRMVLDIDAIGPELAFATATVTRARRAGGDPSDPWATASRNRPTSPAGPTADDLAGGDPPF